VAQIKKLNNYNEIILTAALTLLTLLSTVLFYLNSMDVLFNYIKEKNIFYFAEQIVFMLIIFFFIYGSLIYQFTRWGYFRRKATHRKAGWEELGSLYDEKAPSLTILIPSYKEDVDVVRRTLLSAAVQDYPDKRIVLLIDDPPNPASATDRDKLEAIRTLPGEIQQILEEARKPFEKEFDGYLERCKADSINTCSEMKALANQYQRLSAWFSQMAFNHPLLDHADRLLVDKVFQNSAHIYQANAQQLLNRASEKSFSKVEIMRHYRRLASLFSVNISGFERKRYVNLSHEPNKAMNLNSYIGLMGRSFREVWRDNSLHLEPALGPKLDLVIPSTEFIIMLDADSLLVPDYAIRLISHMTQPDNKSVAVAQTPYSTIPNAPGILERVAGATTDIQYIMHQGFTAYDVTYWVGANALIRKAALDDIAQEGYERGFPIIRYIQDRTVIEDTESSVDLTEQGWKLYNYPDRLAYSATPPDFGSLVIQRCRWANGGLLILPKLVRYLMRSRDRLSRAREGFFQIHYLFSITAVNFGLLILILFPFENSTHSLWLPILTLPYFYLYGRDLVQIGYRWIDLLRIYALNLMLIPINLGGVFCSIRQCITGHKTPFKRTPKMINRTAAPAIYLLAEYGLFLVSLLGFMRDLYEGFWLHSTFNLITMGFLGYAIVWFIGLKESAADLTLAYTGWKNIFFQKMLRTATITYQSINPSVVASKLKKDGQCGGPRD